MALRRTYIELRNGWSFKQVGGSDADPWLPVKKVPSEVHQDLMDNGKYESFDPNSSCKHSLKSQ